MSEYQYYEFQAVDRVLSVEEMRELRNYSSRARITRTSFVNHYEWGSFKGDEDRWMDSYFDAFLYLSNWGTRVLMLRLPAERLALSTTGEFCAGYPFAGRKKGLNVTLAYSSDGEPDEDWTDGGGILSSILPVRAELARGDRRALYLGWLLTVDAGVLKDRSLEPPVPPGLQQLSPSLEAFVEFLRLDRHLLEVAAEASTSIASPPDGRSLAKWVATMPAREKDAWLLRFVTEDGLAASAGLRRAFEENRGIARDPTVAPTRRTVGELRRAAKGRVMDQTRTAKLKAAAEKERRQRETARAREAYLDSLVGKEARLWAKVGKLVARTQPGSYDTAVVLPVDLRDLCSRSNPSKFSTRLEKLRASHSRKGSFLMRLTKAGL